MESEDGTVWREGIFKVTRPLLVVVSQEGSILRFIAEIDYLLHERLLVTKQIQALLGRHWGRQGLRKDLLGRLPF